MNKELNRLEFIADKYFDGLPNITKLLKKKSSFFNSYKKRKGIGNEVLKEMEEKLGINPSYVKYGNGEMLIHKDNIVREKNLNTPGYRIKLLMKEKNWKLQDIADLVGVTNQSVSGWKNGREIPLYALEKLKENGVDIDWLINGDGKEKDNQRSNEDDVRSFAVCLYNKELRAMTIDEVEQFKDRVKNVYDVLNEFIIATESVYGNQLTGKKDITEEDMISIKLVGKSK